MAEHTKGPWHWRKFGNHWALTTTHSGSLIVLDCVRKGMQGADFRVRVEPCRMVPFTEDHPDARLIAAAPELLSALKSAVNDYEFLISDHPELDPDGEFPKRLEGIRAVLAKAEGK